MKQKPVESGRRTFLVGMMAASGAAAVGALSPGEESAAQSTAAQSPAPEAESKGYQRTAHVEAYYRSLRS
jgi:hypothetical protein